jgi:hypothetical protein
MSVFQESIAIFRSSWNVLWKDKELLLFPIISAIGTIAIFLASIALFHAEWMYPDGVKVLKGSAFHYGLTPYIHWFITMFALHFVINVINAAIVASTMRRLSGENPTMITDFKDVLGHWKQITGWAFLVAVFYFLMGLFKRKGWLGRIIGNTVEMAASLAFYFVVPIIMIENQGPYSAVKRSVELLCQTWGRQIVARTGLYLVITLLQVPAIILLVFAFDLTDPNHLRIANVFPLSLAGVYIAVLMAVYNALNEIVRTVLFIYARDGKVPEGFSKESLQLAFKPA